MRKFEGIFFRCELQGHNVSRCQDILKDGIIQEVRTHIVEVKPVVEASEVVELRKK